MSTEMTNVRSDRVAHVRALVTTRSARRRAGVFVAEGPQSVREAVQFAGERVRDLYVSEPATSRWSDIVAQALALGCHVHPASREVLERMSPDAQGILAVVSVHEVTLADLDLSAANLVVIAEELRDPGNLGTIVRAADACGADAVILTEGSVAATSPKVVRSSAGSLFHLPVVEDVALADAVGALKRAGLAVVVADGEATLELPDYPQRGSRVAWILGNEAHGVSEDASALADVSVRIPMPGRAESLNVAMAATLVLYDSARARAWQD